MNAEYPIIDDNRQRQEIEHIREVSPNVRRAVFPDAFCVEAIGL